MRIYNKPEKTIFTKLFEDGSENLRIEVCGVTNSIEIYQYDEGPPIELDGIDTEWLISNLKDSLRLIEYE